MAKTELGFDIVSALKAIQCDLQNWSRLCQSKASGGYWYKDPIHGEQHVHFSYLNNKLVLEFSTANTLCHCQDISSCDCDNEVIIEDFSSFQEYWQATHDTIQLTKSKVASLLTPNLFNSHYL